MAHLSQHCGVLGGDDASADDGHCSGQLRERAHFRRADHAAFGEGQGGAWPQLGRPVRAGACGDADVLGLDLHAATRPADADDGISRRGGGGGRMKFCIADEEIDVILLQAISRFRRLQNLSEKSILSFIEFREV